MRLTVDADDKGWFTRCRDPDKERQWINPSPCSCSAVLQSASASGTVQSASASAIAVHNCKVPVHTSAPDNGVCAKQYLGQSAFAETPSYNSQSILSFSQKVLQDDLSVDDDCDDVTGSKSRTDHVSITPQRRSGAQGGDKQPDIEPSLPSIR